MKLAVIGAGSTYTPELVSHLSRLDVDEVALHDVDAERLEIVGALAGRMLERQGFAGKVLRTTDLDAALDAAAFVLVQIRVGGQQARLRDGSRKITYITEVQGMEGDTIVLQDIFRFKETGTDAHGKVLGTLQPTGLIPNFVARLEDAGQKIDRSMFYPR